MGRRRDGLRGIGALAGGGLGPELVVNGTFDTDISSWIDASTAPATFTWDATQAAKLIRSDTNNARMDQSMATEIGASYRLTFTNSFLAQVSVGSASFGSPDILMASSLQPGSKSFNFTATTTTSFLRFITQTVGTALIDNVSVKKRL